MNQEIRVLGWRLRHVLATSFSNHNQRGNDDVQGRTSFNSEHLKSFALQALIWLSVLFGVAMAIKMMAFQIRHNIVVAFTVGWIVAMMAGFFFFTVALVSLFAIAVIVILLWKGGRLLFRPVSPFSGR
jgi:hypothetical protein